MGTASDPLAPVSDQGQGQEPAMGTASDPLAPVSGLDLALDQEPALQLEAPHSD